MFPTIYRNLKSRFGFAATKATRQPYRHKKDPLYKKLQLEVLEDRTVPSAVRPGFDATIFPGNDDSSVGPVSLGFSGPINFFGPTYSSLFVNNNGNVTFGTGDFTYTPFGLTSPGQLPRIAPFFADVDTRPGPPDIDTRYGTGIVNAHAAFGVTWPNVGYYSFQTDRLNKFQLVIIERFDTGPGNFDIEFNYDQIQWDTGQVSTGFPAHAGFTNGTGTPGTNFELTGSGVSGAFFDTNLATGLIHNSLNSNVNGRYVFSARAGTVIVNQPPTAEANGPYAVAEGGSVGLSSAGSNDTDGVIVSYEWDFNYNGVTFDVDAIGPSPTFSAAGLDGPSSRTVALRVTDDDGAFDIDEATVNVSNVDPVIDTLAATSVAENGTVHLTGTYHDVGTPDTHTLTINWGEGAPETVPVSGGAFDITHQYLDDNPSGDASNAYTIGVTLTDDDLGADTDSTTTTITNVNPEIVSLSLSSTSINEGSSTTLTVDWNDPGTLDTYTVAINWGDGTIENIPAPASSTGSSSQSYTHIYRDDGGTSFVDSLSPLGWLNMTPGDGTSSNVYPITVVVTDDDTGSDSADTSVTVNNVDPTLSAIQGVPLTDDPDQCNTTWVVTGQFFDPGTDTYRFEINWGDGTIDIFNVPGFNGFPAPDSTDIPAPGPYGTFGLVANGFPGSASHTYGAFGTYTITVSIFDDDGGATSSALVGVVAVEATAEIVTDPVWGKILDIHGTDFADEITVNQATENGALVYTVHANSWVEPRTYAADGVQLVRIHLCEGDDHGVVSSGVDVPSLMFGEGGNDHLNVGKHGSIAIGGDGDDMLIGGNGKDILIGGRGADRIVGHSGDDLLIAGTTSYDADDAALNALISVWDTGASYASRVAAVQSSGATYHLIADGLDRTVFSDDSVDQLTGSSGSDLFFADTTLDESGAVTDIITDLKNETALDIDLV